MTTTLQPRLYFTMVATAEDEATLYEWARTQAAIQRRDPDVVDVDVRIVTDSPDGQITCELLEV